MIQDRLVASTQFSEARLTQLRHRLLGIPELAQHSGLAIYVTGSYGRLEASNRSDLDLFLVLNDSSEAPKIGSIQETLIRAQLIKVPQELGCPAFTDSGRYLEIHSLKEMLRTLGGREDDSQNHFTARLLLLLESRPLFNDIAYDSAITQVIEAYFRDYHDHETNFRPIFLVNDILRFWKTLCLNYENKRNIPTGDIEKKRKVYLKNLKLKFSRLLTCFSTVIPLSAAPNITPNEISQLVRSPPLKRLEQILNSDPEKGDVYSALVDLYVWFLQQVSQEDAEEWIGDKANRDEAFEKAKLFGSLVYQLLQLATKDTDNFRYLVI